MADFLIAHENTSPFEGGWANHLNDHGKETYRGIARGYHASWPGWKIIDTYKKAPSWPKGNSRADWRVIDRILAGNSELQGLVVSFYKHNFWNPIQGDLIHNQESANNIYDFAVNSGLTRAVRYAQRIVWEAEDGIMGPKTIKAINLNSNTFVQKYKDARMEFVNKIVSRDESQRVFLAGWEQRIINA